MFLKAINEINRKRLQINSYTCKWGQVLCVLVCVCSGQRIVYVHIQF